MPPRSHTCVTLFVPCEASSPSELASYLPRGTRVGADGSTLEADALGVAVDFDWVDNDGTFGNAFSFGTCSAAEVAGIDGAGGAFVLYLPFELHVHREPIAALAWALRDAGALAFRIEQSKVGYAVERWLSLLEAGDSASLYRLAVMVLEGKERHQSVGMHVFSMPDGAICASRKEASTWLGALGRYQLDEDPLLVSGNTFTLDPETPRRSVEWWPDVGYPRGHPCNNPYGVLHLGEPGAPGWRVDALRLQFMPALVAVLLAAQREKGASLSDEEILAIRDRGVCMAAPWNVTRDVERARGYADIDDPERVVECWRAMERHAVQG